MSTKRGRYLDAVVQIVRVDREPTDRPWAACPLFEGNLELAERWLRDNHKTLTEDLDAH
jgi:hypothetical protein